MDENKVQCLNVLFKKPIEQFYALQVRNNEELRQVAQFYLLSFSKRVFWLSVNSYDLVQTYLNGEDLLALTREFPVVIVYHTGQEMQNRQLPNITKQVLDYRKMHSMYTLFLSQVSTDIFGFKATSPWSLAGSTSCVGDV